MTFARSILALFCSAGLFAPAALAAEGAASLSCGSIDACITGLMSAARAGDQVGALNIMRELPRVDAGKAPQAMRRERPDKGKEALPRGTVDDTLFALLNGPELFNPFLPEPPRVIAFAYLKANRPQEAALVLGKAIAGFPWYAPYWIDLATALTMQGNSYGAVSALVQAHDWAADQGAMHRNFSQAAEGSPTPMAPVYREALRVIDRNVAVAAQLDASLPAVYAGAGDESPGRPDVPASADFNSCAKPEWRKLSLLYKETGPVTLHFYVDAAGNLVRARKAVSSGYPDQDNAALVGVSGCKFTPASKDGKPVASWTKLQYVWSLDK